MDQDTQQIPRGNHERSEIKQAVLEYSCKCLIAVYVPKAGKSVGLRFVGYDPLDVGRRVCGTALAFDMSRRRRFIKLAYLDRHHVLDFGEIKDN
jgi:hypothetical protein